MIHSAEPSGHPADAHPRGKAGRRRQEVNFCRGKKDGLLDSDGEADDFVHWRRRIASYLSDEAVTYGQLTDWARQQLGAITKGDRRAADASDLSMFDVDTKWGKKAYDELIELLSNPLFSSTRPPPPYVRRALGLKANDELHARWKEYLDDAEEAVASVGINTDDKGSVKGFLNRLLGMCVKMQNKVFDHFMAILEEKVRVAKQNGEFDDGVVDIRGESVKVGPPPRGAAPGDASRTLLGTVLRSQPTSLAR